MARHKILAIGEDEALLQSRVAVLQQHYDAAYVPARTAMEKLRAEHFALLLVCHSIGFEQANALIEEAHEAFPSLCIVRLRTVATPDIVKPVAHAIVTIDHKPTTWVKAVDRLLASSAG